MKIKIPYGLKEKEVDFSEFLKVSIISQNKVSLEQKKVIIKKALENPFKCIPFVEWVKRRKKVLFVINDSTRPTPTFDILQEVNKRMNIEKAKYIVATGAHKGPNDAELALIFGDFYNRLKPNIVIHNARNKKSLKKLGTTKKSTEVWINKKVTEADAIIPIGSVEPHYFAGFTGGRKSFFPGLAGYMTIEQNHKLAMENGAEPLHLEENPVHIDLLDAFKKIPYSPIFSIQTVAKNKKDIYSVFCGEIHESFFKACEYARGVFGIKIREKADIVITVARTPLDKTLYQAHKAIEHGKIVLKKGGIIILVASCNDGLGPDNFCKLLSFSDDPDTILKRARDGYKLGYHKAARIAELSKKADIWIVSEINSIILKNKFIKPFNSLREAVKKAIDKKGKDAKILIILDGGNMVPEE